MNNILQFDQVSFRADSHRSGDLIDAHFVLAPAGIMMIHMESDFSGCCLPDLAQGLLVPDSGSILFKGQSWQMMSSWQQGLCRAEMGRVFRTGGWISNLTVRENVILRRRHSGAESETDLLREAEDLASIAGLSGLTHARPENVIQSELQRAAWVRAFMGRPPLVLLDHPEQGVEKNAVAALCDLADRARQDGSSIIWLTPSPHIPCGKWGGQAVQYDLNKGRLTARTGGSHGSTL